MKTNTALTVAIGFGASLACSSAAFAQDSQRGVDWKKLNLNPPQTQQIQQLDTDWNSKYLKIQPDIVDHQRKLRTLLLDPKSDPLEIMSANQSIARLKEQLRNEATANYLRKRSLLNGDQQHQLESMMQQMIAARQQGVQAPHSDESVGFMDAIQSKVRWMIQQR